METNTNTNCDPMVTVEGLCGLSVRWILEEVRDRYVAGCPIYPVTGNGLVSADPATLAGLADALDSRADWLEANDIHPASECRRMRRDAARMRHRAESFWVWRKCAVCGGLWSDYPLDPCACPECERGGA